MNPDVVCSQSVALNAGGMVFLVLGMGFVVTLATWCLRRVLAKTPP